MKTINKALFVTAIAAGFALANPAIAGEKILSPRAADTQIKTVSGENNDPNLTASSPTFATPRATGNEIKTAAGTANDSNPALDCGRKMTASPKAIGACAEHPGAAMPCCSVAETK